MTFVLRTLRWQALMGKWVIFEYVGKLRFLPPVSFPSVSRPRCFGLHCLSLKCGHSPDFEKRAEGFGCRRGTLVLIDSLG